MKIQRWYRSLAYNHRRIFMITSLKNLKMFNDESFFLKLSDYMEIVNKTE